MLYVCRVCNYRLSALANVEAHFRTWHGTMNNLLFLFCLEIFKLMTSFVDHAWRHWNKRVFPCSKCWLHCLNLKEKTEHQTKNYQSFKKPEQLQALPPETEVMIRTSVQLGLSWFPWVRQHPSLWGTLTPKCHPGKLQRRLTTNTKYSTCVAAKDLAKKNYVLPTSRNSKKHYWGSASVHKDPAWLLLFSFSVVSVHHHFPKLAQTHSVGLLMPSNHRVLCHAFCSCLQ